MISQEEYELLKKCDDKFKWVARDKNTELWVYTKKPYKGMYRWDSVGNINLLPRRSKYLFQFIQWDDEEPYRISDLVKEYEDGGDIGYTLEEYAKYIIKFSEKLLTESEEKMKKDKDWLSQQVGDLNSTNAVFNESGISYIDTAVSIERVFDLINQLDEPEVKQLERKIKELESFNDELIRDNNQLRNELDNQEVLSQDWIEEYAQGDYDEWIYTEDLQNLIVPKQELPVVPTWFDEWWKDVTKGEGNLFHNIEQFYDELFSSGTREMYNYISGPDNKKKLLDIIVNELEYVVESEQRYYAKIKGHELLSDREDSYWNVDREELYIDNIWHDYSGYKTTKLSKYDWNNLGINEDNADFVKVEEVE